MVSAASLSACGRYRYELTRVWAHEPLLTFVMLNPSTADADKDDPTIRRCIGFAKRDGFGGLRVVNLFAFRATQPTDMRAADDPIGPENEARLIELFSACGTFVAAWGAGGQFAGQASRVRSLADMFGVELQCLGTTKDGYPRHPLYVKADQPLVALV